MLKFKIKLLLLSASDRVFVNKGIHCRLNFIKKI